MSEIGEQHAPLPERPDAESRPPKSGTQCRWSLVEAKTPGAVTIMIYKYMVYPATFCDFLPSPGQSVTWALIYEVSESVFGPMDSWPAWDGIGWRTPDETWHYFCMPKDLTRIRAYCDQIAREYRSGMPMPQLIHHMLWLNAMRKNMRLTWPGLINLLTDPQTIESLTTARLSILHL